MQKPILVLGAVLFLAVSAGVVGIAQSAYAESGSGRGSVLRARDDSVDSPDDSDIRTATAVSDETDRAEEIRQRVEEARQRGRERLEAKKAEVRTKLEGQRLERCEKQQSKINSIVAKRADQGGAHLDVFIKIKERVIAFKEEKNLAPADYEAVLADVEAKEQAALTAIEAARSAKLDCTAEGVERRVGLYVKSTVSDMKEALKTYRTSIKDLIKTVKQSLPDDSASSESEPENESTADTSGSAAGEGR